MGAKVKRMLAAGLLLIFLCGIIPVFSACGDKEKADTTVTTETEISAEEKTEAADETSEDGGSNTEGCVSDDAENYY